MRTLFAGARLSLGLAGCYLNDTYDPNRHVHVGEDARKQILRWAHSATRLGENGGVLPASAKAFWLYDGGSFGGSITYATFDCDDAEDCIQAVVYLGGIRPDDLKPWEPSRYAVVMEGVGYYSKHAVPPWKGLKANPWDVRGIRRGLVYEQVTGGHRSMNDYAIDLDRNRVDYHHESGGFPPEEDRPGRIGGGERRQSGF